MNKNEKKEFVTSLESEISKVNSLILIHYHGLNVNEITELRRTLSQSNITFKVAKNNLVKLAFKNSSFQAICQNLTGPTAMIYSSDPVANARIVVDFANNNEKVKIVAGVVDAKVINYDEIKYLATLPSLDILRAKILGVINAPATKITQLVQEVSAKVVRVINTRTAE